MDVSQEAVPKSARVAEPIAVPKVLGRNRRLSFRLPPFNRSEPTERVIGHRGSRGTHPENTMPAFAHAWESGCHVLETDAQVTADGVVVCFHDDTLERVTGLPGTVADYDFAELQEKARVRGPYESQAPILRLAELIGEFRYAQLVIDVKDGRAIDPLVKLINSTHSAGRICVTHAWDSWLEEIRDRTSPLLQRNLGWETMAELVRAVRTGTQPDPSLHVANWVHIAWRDFERDVMADSDFSQKFVEAAHQLGMGVRVWTVNDFGEAARLYNEGVDAIFTDFPKQMVQLVRSRDQRNKLAKILQP